MRKPQKLGVVVSQPINQTPIGIQQKAATFIVALSEFKLSIRGVRGEGAPVSVN